MAVLLLVFCLLFQVIAGNYDSYKLHYRVEIANKKTNDILVDECFVTSLPIEYQVANGKLNIKYENLIFNGGFSFCDGPKHFIHNDTAIITNGTDRCGLVKQIRNARASNIKLLIIVSDQLYLPYIKNELDQFPIVVIFPSKTASMVDKYNAHRGYLKATIYVSVANNKLGNVLTGLLLFSIILGSLILIIITVVVFNKQHVGGFPSVSNIESKNMKWIVLICPIMMVGSLLLLYFFYNVMVWVVMIFFYIAASFTTMRFGMLFLVKFDCLNRLVYPFKKLGFETIDLRALALFAVGLAMATVWIVNRNNMIGLVFNNIIGVLLCSEIAVGFGILFVMTRNFRLLVLLLAVTLVIDVLMVYIPAQSKTPAEISQVAAFMKNDHLSRFKRDSGESIMERVASGTAGTSGEELPIRFKIPRIDMTDNSTVNSCQNILSYSMVGFGDVILPGAFIAYILTFAVMATNSVVLYSIFTFFCYSSGLAITYLVVHFAERGQPALVFLIPCTIIPTLLLSVIKKDFAALWNHTWMTNLIGTFNQVDDEEMLRVEQDGDVKPL